MTERSNGVPKQRSIPEVSESDLPAAVTSILFATAEAATLPSIARTTGYEVRRVRQVLRELGPDLERLGLILQWPGDDRVQLATRPEFSAMIRRYLGIERTTRLSPAALEVVAIIVYRQPVTRPEIDAVRGVDSSGVIQTLIAHELIEPVGRLQAPGNPIQFGTTGEFLRLFGLSSLDELPDLPEKLLELVQADEFIDEEQANDGSNTDDGRGR